MHGYCSAGCSRWHRAAAARDPAGALGLRRAARPARPVRRSTRSRRCRWCRSTLPGDAAARARLRHAHRLHRPARRASARAGEVAVYLPMSYQVGGYTVFVPRERGDAGGDVARGGDEVHPHRRPQERGGPTPSNASRRQRAAAGTARTPPSAGSDTAPRWRCAPRARGRPPSCRCRRGASAGRASSPGRRARAARRAPPSACAMRAMASGAASRL